MKAHNLSFLTACSLLTSCSFADLVDKVDPFSNRQDSMIAYNSGIAPKSEITEKVLILDAGAFGALSTGTKSFNEFYHLKFVDFLNSNIGFTLDTGESVSVESSKDTDTVRVTLNSELNDFKAVIDLLKNDYASLYFPKDSRFMLWRVYFELPDVASEKFAQRLNWYLKNDTNKWDIDGWDDQRKSEMRDQLLQEWIIPWKHFISQYKDGDQLWYYITPLSLWEKGLGSDGYVLFREDQLVDFIAY